MTDGPLIDVSTEEAKEIERRFERNIDVLDALRRHCLAHGWNVVDDPGDSMPYAFSALKQVDREVTTLIFDLDEDGRLDLSKMVVSQGSTRLIAEAWIEEVI